MRQIYLDYNATTPIAPSVVEAMAPFLKGHYGNPSSAHSLGRAAAEAIEDARAKVAALLSCEAREIVFTSGGSESNNLAIKGVMFAGQPGVGHLVISGIEHPAVTQPAKFLQRMGYELTVVPCGPSGVVEPQAIKDAIKRNTRLVSVMHANNEIGTIQPIRDIASACHEKGVLFHTDAAQSVGKIPTFVDQMDVDMLTLAGHKFYGPKGIGALFVREGVGLEPLVHGASQENGMRAGTENTPLIVGLGQACFLAGKAMDDSSEAVANLRDRLAEQLLQAIPDARINGDQAKRLPNTLNISFPGVSAREMLRRLPELCASTGSACHSSGQVESVTLSMMGRSNKEIAGTIRLSLGWHSSEEEIDRASSLLIDAWEVLAASVH